MGAGISSTLAAITERYEKELNTLLGRKDVQIVRNAEDQTENTHEYLGAFRVTIDAPCLDRKTTTIHSFHLTPFPHCCGLLISSSARTRACWCAKGIGSLMNEYRTKVATLLGYTRLICTDVTNNVAQNKILDSNNWQKIHEFRNSRTDHNVGIYVVET